MLKLSKFKFVGSVSTNWFEGLVGVTNCRPHDKIANYTVQQDGINYAQSPLSESNPGIPGFLRFTVLAALLRIVPRKRGEVHSSFIVCA